MLSKYLQRRMFLYVCLLVLLVPVTPLPVSTEATPGPSHESGPSSQAPVHAAAEFQDKTQEIGTKTGGDSSKVTIEAGHYKVTVDQEILDLITDFFNTLDSNEDDVLDSSELADEWEQLDVDGDGVLSSEEIHGKLTWFELYAFDVDGDGIATNREFERATKSLDIDGNGKVEFNEFIVKTGMIRNQNKDSHNTYRR